MMYTNDQNEEICDKEYFETMMDIEEGFNCEKLRMDLLRYCKEKIFFQF